jgi:hypothetical protein
MPKEDSWDWPLLLYTATVILCRTEKQFWTMTPRKLSALAKVHVELNTADTDEDNKPQQTGFIDQIF